MAFSKDFKGREQEIAALFKTAFTVSEGDQEGALIGSLATRLLAETAEEDLFVFTALKDDGIAAAIVFSRLRYPDDTRSVFVLGPVAVAPEWQGRGMGQDLIRFGLDGLRRAGVDIAMTYGDPAFYSKVGFAPVTESFAPAPFPLQYPHGWLGQPLSSAPFTPLEGACQCVAALDDPIFW